MDWVISTGPLILAWLLVFVPSWRGWLQAPSKMRRLSARVLIVLSALLTVWLILPAPKMREAEERTQASIEIQKVSQAERQAKIARVKPIIEERLLASDKMRDAMYGLCNIPDFERYEAKIEKEWREPIIRFLDREVGSAAKDEFQRVRYHYEHWRCGRIEWVQLWLAELTDNLRRIRDILPNYIQ